MKRAALVAGVSATALICAFTACAAAAPAATQSSSSRFGFFRQRAFEQPVRPPEKKSKYLDGKPAKDKSALHEADKTPPIPKGPLHIIVSIDKQRATLYADGQVVAQTKISSGTATHPTPMGVFSVLQKNKHHVSNLYDAKMPYMQRITWSGAALHEGPLPGYPASHGCVRLTNDFAQLLWKVTKIGARVIISRDEPVPVEIAHERLFVAKARTEEPKVESKPELRREPAAPKPETNPGPKLEVISERKAVPARSGETIETRAAMATVKTADATGSLRGPVLPDVAVKPLVPGTARNTAAAEQPTKLPLHGDVDEIAMPPAPASTSATTAARRPAPAVAERPAPVVAERAAAIPAEAMAKQDRIEPPVAPAVAPVAAGAPAPAAVATAPPPRKGTVSVFVSLKENRVYVRQNMEPLFDAPVSVARPGEPIGTHVYTAMGAKPDGSMRWTVVSIPSAYKAEPKAESKIEPRVADAGRRPRSERPVRAVEPQPAPLPSAGAALDRIVMPQDTVERIASLITPGASLIVSDNKLSGETGATTDFIVETRPMSDAADGLARHQPRRLPPRQYY
ncbi:MAG: L,D-transpeptidase family protein [Xanthobacteraceae bacterium]|nr:L,D-transpeptidase family protein [Xanthobacteraceae bacterium]